MGAVVAVVQARMGSSRLPGKMLADIDGHTLVDYVLSRLVSELGAGRLFTHIVLASSTNPENDRLVEHVSREWPLVRVVRGSENDVLSRFAEAVRQTGANVIVRVTGDCPLVNMQAVGQMLDAWDASKADVVNYRPGYEYVDKGVEIVSADVLLKLADDKDLSAHDREHVTSAIYRNSDHYRTHYIDSESQLRRADFRLTIDTDDDLRFFRALSEYMPRSLIDAPLSEVLAFLEEYPELAQINSGSGRKSSLHESVRIGFRCDGGAGLGMGHIVGSLRLARLLADRLGWGAEFVCREEVSVRSAIHARGFAMERLPEDISPEADVTRLLDKALESDWSAVVFNFGKDDLERYRDQFGRFRQAGIKLVFMDNPVAPYCYEADLLINALPHPDYPGYQPGKHRACLDGLEYFIPAESVSLDSTENEIRRATNVERVLVAMGGGDVTALTVRVLEGLGWAGFRGYVDVVVGHPDSGTVVGSVLQSLGLNGAISCNVGDMPKRIQMADVGFTGLGLTTYEMAYQGLPALIVANSRFNATVARAYVSGYGGALLVGAWPDVTSQAVGEVFLRVCDSSRRCFPGRSRFRVGSRVGDVVKKMKELIQGTVTYD